MNDVLFRRLIDNAKARRRNQKIAYRVAAFLLAFIFVLLALSIGKASPHHHYRHHHRPLDANGNYATVQIANGKTSKVAAAVRDQFQRFIDMAQEAGAVFHDFGCLARGGHMPGSKHYRGLACDFDQEKRNVTTEFMHQVTAIAQLVGLTDGCTWQYKRGERHTGPDCGHIEVPGPTLVASRHTHRHKRWAGI